jgi:hypothetical protein
MVPISGLRVACCSYWIGKAANLLLLERDQRKNRDAPIYNECLM